jgi:hypothetical protein
MLSTTTIAQSATTVGKEEADSVTHRVKLNELEMFFEVLALGDTNATKSDSA